MTRLLCDTAQLIKGKSIQKPVAAKPIAVNEFTLLHFGTGKHRTPNLQIFDRKKEFHQILVLGGKCIEVCDAPSNWRRFLVLLYKQDLPWKTLVCLSVSKRKAVRIKNSNCLLFLDYRARE